MNVRALGTMGNTSKHGIKKEKRLRKLKIILCQVQ